jgi:hypothetical protein
LRNVRYVRFGSLADIKARIRDVRLSLKSGHGELSISLKFQILLLDERTEMRTGRLTGLLAKGRLQLILMRCRPLEQLMSCQRFAGGAGTKLG